MAWLRNRWAAWQHRRVMRRIRETFAFFGCPLDHLTDAEIEQKLLEASRAMATIGITADEAERNLRTFAEAR